MRINRFTASQLHGYLDFDVGFNPSLTFLTGINGSGKTTVVRAMAALLAPRLKSLGAMRFEKLRIDFSHESEDRFIAAERTDEEILLTCSDAGAPLTIPIFRADPSDPSFRHAEHEAEFYSDQEVLRRGDSVMSFIDTLPTPMFLDLERRTVGETHQRHVSNRPSLRRPRNVFGGTLEDSLSDAAGLAGDAYARGQANQREMTNELRKQLIMTAFQKVEGAEFGMTMPEKGYVKQLRRNRALVIKTLEDLGVDPQEIKDNVGGFFDTLITLVKSLPTQKQLDKMLSDGEVEGLEQFSQWWSRRPQEIQIQRIVELVEEHTANVRQATAPVDRYLESVNQFFVHSGKTLSFQSTGRLTVLLPAGTRAKLSALSSGERQLVVILTHLAFNPQAERANVLIIDEPELSLHVQWQESFVDALLAANPRIQYILATHSPSILLDRTQHGVALGSS